MSILSLNFSIAALMFYVTSIICQDKVKILLFQIPANICYSLSYFFGGFVVAGVGVIIATIRTIIFFAYTFSNKKISILWLSVFLICTIVCGLINFNKALDILPIVGIGVFSYATWQSNEKVIKIGAAVLSICLLIYNIFGGIYIGVIQESILLISAILSIKKSKISIC